MIVSEQRLLEFMGMPDVQFVIPVYQRVYSWTERQCEELWADLQRAGSTGKGGAPQSLETLSSQA